jgi:anti-sigma factor RsiW
VYDSIRPGGAFAELLAAVKAEEPRHLIYEQVAAYVDDGLNDVDREIATSHLELCRECAERVTQLRDFKLESAGPREKEWPPSEHKNLRYRLIAFWSRPARWLPLQLAATAVIAATCVFVVTGSLRARVAQLAAERDRLTQTNESLKAQTSDMAELRARVGELERKNEALQRDYTQARASADDLQAQLRKAQRIQAQTSGGYSQQFVALNDGDRRVTLNRRGKITGLESLPESYQQSVKEALMAQRIDVPPDLQELAGRSGSLLRGASPGLPFSLIAPVGTAVQSDRPTFRWNALHGATGYIVTVFDSNFNRLTISQTLLRTEWAPSESLERGRAYSWQVTAIKDGERIKSPVTPAPEARFKVLESARSAELESAKKTYNSHLLLGILYARAGLLDDAEGELQTLLKANPRSPVARHLLREIKALRPN